MRGDRPAANLVGRQTTLFTPHARGSTYEKALKEVNLQVYPACAGIDL